MPIMKRRFKGFRGRSWSWWRSYADRKQQPQITISDSFVAASAGIGDLVARLTTNHGSGTYTYALLDNAGGRFAIDGSNIKVASALSASVQTIEVRANNGVDEPLVRTFTITVA